MLMNDILDPVDYRNPHLFLGNSLVRTSLQSPGAANISLSVFPCITMSTVWSWEQNSPPSKPPPHSLARSMVVCIIWGIAFAGAKPVPTVCSPSSWLAG